MGMSDEFYNTMIRSKGMISDRNIVDLITKDITIDEISSVSEPSNTIFDLMVTTSSKKTCADLIRNGITLSDNRIAKVKALFVDHLKQNQKHSTEHRRGMPFGMPGFPFPQRMNHDEWEEEQFSKLQGDDRVRPNFNEEPIFGMGNSEYNEFSRGEPIFHQDSFA